MNKFTQKEFEQFKIDIKEIAYRAIDGEQYNISEIGMDIFKSSLYAYIGQDTDDLETLGMVQAFKTEKGVIYYELRFWGVKNYHNAYFGDVEDLKQAVHLLISIS